MSDTERCAEVGGELVAQGPAPIVAQTRAPASILEIIAEAVTNKDIDVSKLQALANLKIQIDAIEARKAFDESVARIQGELPHIEKDGRITGGSNAKYTKYETIDDWLRPLLRREGLSVRCSEEGDSDSEGRTPFAYTGSKGGPSETIRKRFYTDVGATSSRTGSAVRPKIQDDGSTFTYANRYLCIRFWHIVTVGVDNDGNGPPRRVTPDQVKDIEVRLADTGGDKAAFLRHMKIEKLEDLDARELRRVFMAIDDAARARVARQPK